MWKGLILVLRSGFPEGTVNVSAGLNFSLEFRDLFQPHVAIGRIQLLVICYCCFGGTGD